MRILFIGTATLIFGVLSSLATAFGAEPELSLKLSVAQGVARVGAEVRIKIVLTNMTDHEILIGRYNHPDGPEFEYRFDVRDSQNREVPLTKYGRALNGTPDSGDERHDCGDCSSFVETVEPHQTTYDEIVISKIYDLSKPGKYIIQVSRQQAEASHMIVKSNTITLTISE
jgi:hypothetical protein